MLLSRIAPVLSVLIIPVLPVTAQSDRQFDRRVDSTLAALTLEEKVGEMTQLALEVLVDQDSTDPGRIRPDRQALEEAIIDYHIGSILNVAGDAPDLAGWHEIINEVQDVAARRRTGIPILYGIDAVHGHNYMQGAVVFPHNLALAATWNPDLARDAARVTAMETRASGIPWNFAPVLGLGRQPLWSRFYETFGEDVHLASEMGAAVVAGLQGDDLSSPVRVAATAKHFLGYSLPLSGKDRTPAWIPERMLREYLIPPFQAAIDAGARTIMLNSGEINGIPVHADRFIVTELLRHEMGFEGVVVTDWEDIIKLHTWHRVAASEKEAVEIAVRAGIDMSMTPYELSFYDHLLELVREGVIPESRIDESVRRILRLKYELGLFDDPYPPANAPEFVGLESSQLLSQRAAEEAVTLVENREAILPLERERTYLVAGPGATSLSALHGGWSYTWQGTDESAYPEGITTLLDAIRSEARGGDVSYVAGAGFETLSNLDAIVDSARSADVAILCLAEQSAAEKPGDIDDLSLPAAQIELVRRVSETGTPIVIVLLVNRPRVLTPVVEMVDAVMVGYEPGPYGGVALAKVLFGEVNPSGKLPITYPRHTGSIVPYDYKDSERRDSNYGTDAINPQWAFGHGLSYTDFEYSDLQIADTLLAHDDLVAATVRVENSGDVFGKEVVQFYVRDLYASVTPSVKRLRAFEKIELAAGESKTVTLSLPVGELAFVGTDNKWVVEPGAFELLVGDLKAGFTVK